MSPLSRGSTKVEIAHPLGSCKLEHSPQKGLFKAAGIWIQGAYGAISAEQRSMS